MIVNYNYLNQEFSNPNEIIGEWKKLIKSTDFTLGKYVNKFEYKFSKFIGSKYCVSTNNGTDALILCLKALNIRNKMRAKSLFEFLIFRRPNDSTYKTRNPALARDSDTCCLFVQRGWFQSAVDIRIIFFCIKSHHLDAEAGRDVESSRMTSAKIYSRHY